MKTEKILRAHKVELHRWSSRYVVIWSFSALQKKREKLSRKLSQVIVHEVTQTRQFSLISIERMKSKSWTGVHYKL